MENVEINPIQKLHCNTCKTKTRHELKARHFRIHEEPLYENTPNEQRGWWDQSDYRFWVCLGCDTATLEERYTDLHLNSTEPRGYDWDITLYPKREISDLRPKHFSKLGKDETQQKILQQIYKEVIESYNSDLRILCTIGLRALLEGICTDKGVKVDRSAKKTIDGLKSYLPHNMVESLHSFRFMGNNAAHELISPQRNELQLAIEVLEGVMSFFYELEYKIQHLPKEKTSEKDNKNE